MSISRLEAARLHVAGHQTFHKDTHDFWCCWKGKTFKGKTTDEVVLKLSQAMAEDIQNTWRRRIGCDEWTS